jgi:predicted nucleic-acid-binding protein
LIGLDTNVLVRYILQDDPIQGAKAKRAIARLTPENRGFIATTVLCELVWVLKSTYKIPKPQCVSMVEHILLTSDLEVEHSNLCWRALKYFAAGKADFCDYLVRELATASGCSVVLTFDKAALKSEGFEEPC